MANDRFDKKLVIFSVILICSIFIFNQVENAFATTVTNNFQATSGILGTGAVTVEKFSGLGISQNVNSVGINVTATGLGTFPFTNNWNTTSGTLGEGAVSVVKFTNMQPISTATDFQFDLQSTGQGPRVLKNIFNASNGAFGTGAIYFPRMFNTGDAGQTLNSINLIFSVSGGNVRLKVYQDDAGSHGGTAGYPYTLLGETNSISVSSTGRKTFTLNSPVVIPADGNLWIGYETDSSTQSIYYTHGINSALEFLHTYGSGPNPISGEFAAANEPYVELNISVSAHMRIKVYQDDGAGGNPSTLLYETGSMLINSTGVNIIPLSVTIPASGNLYAGLEVDNGETALFTQSGGGATIKEVLHTYGSGPNPFGTVIDQTNGFWSKMTDTVTASHVRVKVYQDDGVGGNPSTLLGESSQLSVNSTGVNTFPVTAIIPASGNVYAGLETDNLNLAVKTSTGLALGTRKETTTHVFGTGPNPFGTVTDLTSANWQQLTYSIPPSFTVQFKPMLHDNQTQLTSATVKITNSTTSQTLTANSTGWVKFTGLSGNQNFTVFDDKNFEVLKIINKNMQSDITQNLVTYDTPFNCISSAIGYQSDVILRINDTDGTHITNISTPTCANQNQISFNMTFTGNGQSGNTFSSSMITTAGSQAFAANPSSFTVSGTTVPTTFTQGNNIVSNSFTIGSGLVTTIKNFVITLTATHGTGSSSQSSGQNYFTTNSTCFAGVFDPKTNTCVFGPVDITIPNVTINTNPNQQSNNNIGVTCDGTGSLTITSVNLGNNPLGIQIGQLPVTVNCGTPTPTQCPTGTTLTNGVCVAPLTCPIGSQTQNGICVGQLTCPDGTTLQNAQCIAQPTCPTGSVMVNGQCQQNTIPIILPPTPSDCSILNPVACVTTTTQSQDVVITATTSDGRVVSSTTTLTKVINPELNNVSLVIILLIIAAIIAGIIYRYLTRKPKKPSGSRHGKSKKIEDFNKSVRKS